MFASQNTRCFALCMQGRGHRVLSESEGLGVTPRPPSSTASKSFVQQLLQHQRCVPWHGYPSAGTVTRDSDSIPAGRCWHIPVLGWQIAFL